ncbi:hypothetical protein DDZ13_07470 [Coraliomargarita sinensis]|uniref:PhoD-like phosphatase metallophosphatase domain-containing protein n=2 Tax=Coraliomargarita sinensis TaxID=2174842 RepID=A0A317ZJG1_9BACT|nr:hypothetical protein DDZ13_07470 [Coraliomargarita sinensis]
MFNTKSFCLEIRKVNVCCFAVMALALSAGAEVDYYEPYPFGDDYNKARNSDNLATGKWWELQGKEAKRAGQWFRERPRNETLAFALYTHDNEVLKMTAQCFPLLPDEPKKITLEFMRDGEWVAVDTKPVLYPGWDCQFRVEGWNNRVDVPYRLRLGDLSSFEGLIRKDPIDKEVIVVASMSCNSPRDMQGDTRHEIVSKLLQQDPDLLFFAGDQNYTHDEATYGWLQFGVQFAELMKDRPTICIPDDHDVGHGNLWGEGGRHNPKANSTGAGYAYPASFVNMVQRQQTANLPDPFDPEPVKQGITVYYTDLTLGGINFAILEDRKFKSGPGNVPKMGPRQDHINDPEYDRAAVDLPGLKLLGERQLDFLDHWTRDWEGAELKVALSQTAFCGAVHLHGHPNNRLLADLDCNGWPQSGRNRALERLRAVRATHLCGDQHLSVMVKHGIEDYRDGPYAFTSPALVNTIYGRWWHPLEEAEPVEPAIESSLPWVGDYRDGLGNRITMLAYANPEDRSDVKQRGDGYGIVRFNKASVEATFECWPRFANLKQGDRAQYEGWPMRLDLAQNDGRKPVAYLDEVELPVENAVVELTEAKSGALVYCYRVKGARFKAPVYEPGVYTLRVGEDRPELVLLESETIP